MDMILILINVHFDFMWISTLRPKSWIIICLMAISATSVMLCFSHVWPDMQRCGERESKMDFKAEASEMLRGPRTCPVLLVEEDLESSASRFIQLRPVFGCLYIWLRRQASKKSGKLWETSKRNGCPIIMCQPYHVKPTHPQNGLKLFDILGLNPRRFIVMVQVKSLSKISRMSLEYFPGVSRISPLLISSPFECVPYVTFLHSPKY